IFLEGPARLVFLCHLQIFYEIRRRESPPTLEGYLTLFRATIFCDSATAMLAKIYFFFFKRETAYEIEIEVNGAGGDPNIVIVGLPDAAVRESRDRVTTAVANSGYYWPRGRTTINLSPADIIKEGPSFDLSIALGMISVTEGLVRYPFEN